jgi:hypothetical protein
MTQVSGERLSREERRANTQIAKINKAREVAPDKIVRELYEETRPRDPLRYRGPVFIDSTAEYDELVRPLVVKDWEALLEQLDERGIFNPRLIRSRSKRLDLITETLEYLISQDIILYDASETKFWLSYNVYLAEVCRDNRERDERHQRNEQRIMRKRTKQLVVAA